MTELRSPEATKPRSFELQRIFQAMEIAELCRAQQRREPGNVLAMIGELDWIAELHALLECVT